MKKRTLLTAFAIFLMIFAFVSCSNEVSPQAEDKLGSITLGGDRTIGYTVKYSEEVENLYWYYKATKLDDGYKTGEQNGWTSVTSDNNQGIDGEELNSDGFSYGYWKIELRGFSTNGTKTSDSDAKYKATIDKFLVSGENNTATAVIEMADGATTEIKFGEDGIFFEEGNITATSKFTLTVEDSVNGVNVGTVDTTGATVTIPTAGGKVTFTGLIYKPNDNTEITGTHQMSFVLSQTLVMNGSETTTKITAAKYTLNFIVNKGTTVTISGSPEKNDDTGAISINGVQNVPQLVISKAVPVDSNTVDDTNKVAEVSNDTTIQYGDFAVVYPKGAIINTSKTDKTLSDDGTTSDAKIGFEYKGEGKPQSTDQQTITLSGSTTSEQFELTLSAAKSTDTTSEKVNKKLLTITKFVGKDKKYEAVYHNNEALEVLTALPTELNNNKTLEEFCGNKERYFYDATNGTLTLYLYNASPIYLVTKNPVASSGETEYYTLSDAVTAATGDGGSKKITLLNDINLDETITVKSSITLDMNNKVITYIENDSKTKGSITVGEGGVIEVKNKNSEQKDAITGVEVKSSDGSCTYYQVFEKALAGGVSNGDIITLCADDNLTTTYTPKVSFTINLNSKTLTVSEDQSTVSKKAEIIVDYGTTITVDDAVDGQVAFIGGVKSSETGINGTYYPRAVSVTSGSSTTYYATIEDAVNDAAENSTVKLLQNVTISEPITITKDVTLQLDNKTITSSGDNLIYVSSGTLTVSGAASDQTEFVQGAKGSSTAVDGTYTPRVARVGNKYYGTFKEAVDGAADGDTVNLLSSVTVSETIKLKKNLTIDLCGKAVNFVDSNNLLIEPYDSEALEDDTTTKNSIDVTIKNGSIDGGSDKCSVIKMCSYVNLTLDAVTMTANKVGYNNALVLLAIGSYNAKLTIQNQSDLTMTGAFCVGTNATTEADVEIVIKDSTITATGNNGDSTGLFVTVPAKVTVENSTISGEKVGVLLRGISSDRQHKATIKNSTIKSTGTGTYEKYKDTNWGTGTEVPAAAIVIGNKLPNNYPHPTTVAFKGTVNLSHASSDAVDVFVYQNDKSVSVTDVDGSWTFNDDFNGAKVKTSDSYYCIENAKSLSDIVVNAVNTNRAGKVRLINDIALSEQLNINSKTITLDLAGKTITVDSKLSFNNPDALIVVKNTGKLIVEDSSDDKKGGVNIVVNEKNVSSCFGFTSSWAVKYKPTLIINGGVFTAPSYAIAFNGSNENAVFPTITIKGGTFEATDGTAIYHPQAGELTIENGKFKGSESAVEVRAGTVTITGGEFISTYNGYECNANGSGTTTKGAAIAVAQHTTKLDIKVTIEGGTFTGYHAMSVRNAQNNSQADCNKVSVTVSGGSFTATGNAGSSTEIVKVGEPFKISDAAVYAETANFTVRAVEDEQ